MKALFKILHIWVFLPLFGCGFAVLDKSQISRTTIQEIKSEGENKINFLIKNNLYSLIKSKEPVDFITLELKTNKTKSIKEKNQRNKITKYNIIIDSNIKIKFSNKKISEEVNVKAEGYYDVSDEHNTTRENQKRLELKLSNEISKKIVAAIIKLTNDY